MIFLGAGASNPFNIPGSNTLTKILIEKLEHEYSKLISDIQYFFNQYTYSLDFENILTILSVLTNPNFIRNEHFSQVFRKGYGHERDYTSIINMMYDKICNECNLSISSFNYEKLDDIFALTYDPLFGLPLSKGQSDLIFSTNYDPSIEIWCQKRNLNCFDGTTATYNPEYKEKMDVEQVIQQLTNYSIFNQKDQVPLIRLHGSIWSYKTPKGKDIKFTKSIQDLHFKDIYKNITEKKPILIFPGQEHLLGRDQWDPLYQFYKNNCIVDYQVSDRASITRRHSHSHVHQRIIQRHLTN